MEQNHEGIHWDFWAVVDKTTLAVNPFYMFPSKVLAEGVASSSGDGYFVMQVRVKPLGEKP